MVCAMNAYNGIKMLKITTRSKLLMTPHSSSRRSQNQNDISRKSQLLHHLISHRRNIAVTFGTEKMEWCGYPIVKKNEDMITYFDQILERDRQDDMNRAYA